MKIPPNYLTTIELLLPCRVTICRSKHTSPNSAISTKMSKTKDANINNLTLQLQQEILLEFKERKTISVFTVIVLSTCERIYKVLITKTICDYYADNKVHG